MHVPIGHDLEDRPVHARLAPGAVVLLIGDPRSGRTTLARHLARCWLADLTHDLRLDVDRPHKNADLARIDASRPSARADGPIETDPRAAEHLGEVGDLWLQDRRHGTLGTTESTDRAGPVVITTEPASALTLTESLGAHVTRVISIEPPPGARDCVLRAFGEFSSLRLHLPAHAALIRMAAFGVADQPPHRWHMVGTAS